MVTASMLYLERQGDKTNRSDPKSGCHKITIIIKRAIRYIVIPKCRKAQNKDGPEQIMVSLHINAGHASAGGWLRRLATCADTVQYSNKPSHRRV